MHAGKPRQEMTGETASIVTLLDAAEREGVMTREQIEGFRFRRQRIRDDLEGEHTHHPHPEAPDRRAP